MAGQFIQVDAPLKGVNRAFGREKQPDGTCYDALNVMPVDRYGRLRVATRHGLGLLDTLEDIAPVQLLHVASSAGTSAASAPAFSFSEPFTYTTGDLDGQGGWELDSGADPSLIITTGVAHTEGLDGYNANRHLTALSGWDASESWTLSFELTLSLVALVDQPTLAAAIQISFSAPHLIFLSVGGGATAGTADVFLQANDGSISDTVNVPWTYGSANTVVLSYNSSNNTFTVTVNGTPELTLDNTEPLDLGDTILLLAAQDGTGSAGSHIGFDNFSVESDEVVAGNISRTALQLVAVSGLNTYIGTPPAMVEVSNSTSFQINNASLYVSAATLFGYTYIVDGTNIRRLNLSTGAFVAFTESAGTVPSGTNIAASWRGRLILAGRTADPQNFYASRAGNPLDWDTGQTDPAAAFAGNTAASGKVGQPIHALIPMSDDLLVIGTEQSMYVVRGDPADGGSIDLLSDGVGISGANSWARGPDGSIYFVGPRGFFKIDPMASSVSELSLVGYPQYFQSFNRKTSYISAIYDPDRYGVWVFVTPLDGASAGTHIFYDLRNAGFWPQQFTNSVNTGPVTAIFWDGYDSDTRYPVLGGLVGGLYAPNSTQRNDNGGAITSSITLGPFHPATGDALLNAVQINQGELAPADIATPARWQASVVVKGGKNAYDVTQGTETGKFLVSVGLDRRPKTFRQRLRGEWFSVTVSNGAAGNYFALESAQLEFEPLGRNRKQR